MVEEQNVLQRLSSEIWVWVFGILSMLGGLTLVMVAFTLRKAGREGLTP